jgi:adenylate cyclase
LAIRRAFAAFAENPAHPLADFQAGIGLASGRAVAGKIGTADQAQVTAFGPVVNLAKRLESMTRQIPAEILLDAETERRLRGEAQRLAGQTRRIARVRPFGMQNVVDLHELLPLDNGQARWSARHAQDYESALVAFQNGNWPQAAQILQSLKAIDPVSQFLWNLMHALQYTPPPDWEGILELKMK